MKSKELQEIKKLKQIISQMKHLINYDSLTGLPNKVLLDDLLKKSIANAKRNTHSIALILLDLNKFKDINETYGNDIGDEILNNISKTLKNNTREGDVVARIEGDIFAIILEQIKDERVLAKVAHNILTAIHQPQKLTNDADIILQACAGISIAPKDAQDVESIFKYAKEALLLAKQDGHGLYRFYTDDITQKYIQKLAYENALKNALSNNLLKLHYQAIYDATSNKIVGAEVLLRWKCKEYGNVPPEIFIPLADETGLIHKIGYFVIDEAAKQLKELNDDGYDISISVNLSKNQVKYQDIVKMLEYSIDKYRCNPKNLNLEITENSLLEKGDEAIEMLNGIKNLGPTITIDRFGSGYSSIALLKEYPINALKIDSSFTKDKKLFSSIVKMGQALELKLIAHKVEEPEDLDSLREKKCDFYQGFIQSKALSAKQFKELLHKQNS